MLLPLLIPERRRKPWTQRLSLTLISKPAFNALLNSILELALIEPLAKKQRMVKYAVALDSVKVTVGFLEHKFDF
jgi:hypothetical protein